MTANRKTTKPKKRGPKAEILKIHLDPKEGLDRLVREYEKRKTPRKPSAKKR